MNHQRAQAHSGLHWVVFDWSSTERSLNLSGLICPRYFTRFGEQDFLFLFLSLDGIRYCYQHSAVTGEPQQHLATHTFLGFLL